MAKTIITKFKKSFEKKVEPRVKERSKLDSEIRKLYSERSKLYSEIRKLDSETNKLYSETHKLYSETNKLDSEIHKLYSERSKLDSEIRMFFYKFGKENNCQAMWENYNFKLEEIELKTYNSDKTGFIFLKMNGSEREELFKKESLGDLSKEQLINKIKELQGD